MSPHLASLHAAVSLCYARPVDAFSALRLAANTIPIDQHQAVMRLLVDTSTRDDRPFLHSYTRHPGLFVGSPWVVLEALGASLEHLPQLQAWTRVQLGAMTANNIRKIREEIPLLVDAKIPLLSSIPRPSWYMFAQHIGMWLPTEAERFQVLPLLDPNEASPLYNDTLVQTHCPQFAAWLALFASSNDWSKAFILDAAWGYFSNMAPQAQPLPLLAITY